MSTYRVFWSIDIEDVEDPVEAARQALEIQRDPESIATVFEVARHADEPNPGWRLADSWVVDLEEQNDPYAFGLDELDPRTPRPNTVNYCTWGDR